MKNEHSNDGLSFFLRSRIHGNVFAWNQPVSNSKPERSKQATENIQRWEDDGGPVSETGTLLPQVVKTNTSRLSDAGSDRS